MEKKQILLAGATGYLGSYITRELLSRDIPVRIVVRNRSKVNLSHDLLEVVEAQITESSLPDHLFNNIDTVISSVGITRQKDGLTYKDVDYQANANLIDGALRNNVRKFIYISVLNGEKLRNLAICDAKEQLGDYLKQSGLDYTIIRPNGFFSDMGDFLRMAKTGRVFLFGDGEQVLNPIHGADLAKVTANSISNMEKVIEAGGPDLLTQNRIAELALEACGKPPKIIHLPDILRRLTLGFLRTFTRVKTYGPLEFFLTTMAMDMKAPAYGTRKLEDFFREEAK